MLSRGWRHRVYRTVLPPIGRSNELCNASVYGNRQLLVMHGNLSADSVHVHVVFVIKYVTLYVENIFEYELCYMNIIRDNSWAIQKGTLLNFGFLNFVVLKYLYRIPPIIVKWGKCADWRFLPSRLKVISIGERRVLTNCGWCPTHMYNVY